VHLLVIVQNKKTVPKGR